MKQKHYTTEKQILDKIDEKREKAKEFNALAESLEAQSRQLLIEAGRLCDVAKTDEQWKDARATESHGRDCKSNSMKARKRAKRIEEVVLPALGEVLAEFLTTPMIPVCGNDHSVASAV